MAVTVGSRKATAEQVRKVFQQFLHYLQMPMSHQKLSRLPIGTLRSLARQFKAYDGVEARTWGKNRLVQFICGHQNDPSQYRPLEKLAGIEYPDIQDQMYRRMFESKIDPWKRPGLD